MNLARSNAIGRSNLARRNWRSNNRGRSNDEREKEEAIRKEDYRRVTQGDHSRRGKLTEIIYDKYMYIFIKLIIFY